MPWHRENSNEPSLSPYFFHFPLSLHGRQWIPAQDLILVLPPYSSCFWPNSEKPRTYFLKFLESMANNGDKDSLLPAANSFRETSAYELWSWSSYSALSLVGVQVPGRSPPNMRVSEQAGFAPEGPTGWKRLSGWSSQPIFFPPFFFHGCYFSLAQPYLCPGGPNRHRDAVIATCKS